MKFQKFPLSNCHPGLRSRIQSLPGEASRDLSAIALGRRLEAWAFFLLAIFASASMCSRDLFAMKKFEKPVSTQLIQGEVKRSIPKPFDENSKRWNEVRIKNRSENMLLGKFQKKLHYLATKTGFLASYFGHIDKRMEYQKKMMLAFLFCNDPDQNLYPHYAQYTPEGIFSIDRNLFDASELFCDERSGSYDKTNPFKLRTKKKLEFWKKVTPYEKFTKEDYKKLKEEVMREFAFRYKIHIQVSAECLENFVAKLRPFIEGEPRCRFIHVFKYSNKSTDPGHVSMKNPPPMVVLYVALIPGDEAAVHKILNPIVYALEKFCARVAQEIVLKRPDGSVVHPRFNYKISNLLYVAGGEGVLKEFYEKILVKYKKLGLPSWYGEDTIFTPAPPGKPEERWAFFVGHEFEYNREEEEAKIEKLKVIDID